MRGRLLIAWFGPRGLSSLLLILLPVFAGLPGSSYLFSVCSLVVLVSVVLHGGSPMLLARAARKRAIRESLVPENSEVARPFGPEKAGSQPAQDGSNNKKPVAPAKIEVASSSTSSDGKNVATCTDDPDGVCHLGSAGDEVQVGSQRITIEELRRLWQARELVTILDVRRQRSLEGETSQAKGAVRMPPDHVVERAKELGLKKENWLVAYCA